MPHPRASENLLERLPVGSRIAIVRRRSLGDCVLTTPAVSLLKAYRPDLRIQVVVEPRFAAIFEGNPDVSEIGSDLGKADLVLNLHGGTRSMLMTWGSDACFRAGFAHHRYSFIYSHKIPAAQEILGMHRRVHTAEHIASAMFWLGVPIGEIPRAKLSAEPPPADLPAYVVIHPFASAPEKTWPADRFVALARHLREAFGLDPVFLAGPSDEPAFFEKFRLWRNAPLAQVKALMAGASLFVGNDSGPAHIAAAFGVPVVALFGPSDPVTWAPWRTPSQVLISRGAIADISIADVRQAVQTLKGKACAR